MRRTVCPIWMILQYLMLTDATTRSEVEAVRARSTEAMTSRRFPAPWTVIEQRRIVLGVGRGRAERGVHNEETARQAKVLTRDEAQRWQ
jgi:hypothetical protein